MRNKLWLLKSTMTLFVILLVFNGCSSDDSKGGEQNIITDTDVFSGQFVKITTSNEIMDDTYQAVFDGIPTNVVKTASNEITFLVPVETQEGVKKLTIEDLSISINYNVQTPVLESTADQTLTPYFSALDQYISQLEESNSENEVIINSVSMLHQYYESLSQEEKIEFAITYQINKEFFDELINPAFPVSPPGINIASIGKLSNLKLAVIGLVGSVFVIEYAPANYKLLGVAGVMISASYVKRNRDVFLSYHTRVLRVSFDGIYFEDIDPLDRPPSVQDEVITFNNDEQKILPIKINIRSIVESDRQTAYGETNNFFSYHNDYAQGVGVINSVINFVNGFPFFNIPTLTIPTVQASSGSSVVNIDNEDYNNFSFSVASSNVQVVSSQYSQGGLSLKLKIINTDLVNGNELATTLNYTYTDSFNSKHNSVPIKIVLEEDNTLIGNWVLIERNGYEANEYVNQEYHSYCLHNPFHQEVFTGTASFSETSFNISSIYRQIGYQVVSVNSEGGTVVDSEGNFICANPPTVTFDVSRGSSYGGSYDFSNTGSIEGVIINVNDQQCVDFNPTDIQINFITEDIISITIPANCIFNLKYQRQ